MEYCLSHGILQSGTDQTYTLPDLAAWLQLKAQAKHLVSRATALYQYEAPKSVKKDSRITHLKEKTAAVLLNTTKDASFPEPSRSKPTPKPKPYCPQCDNKEHYLNSCPEFQKYTTCQVLTWIQDGQRCWKCGWAHKAEACTLK